MAVGVPEGSFYGGAGGFSGWEFGGGGGGRIGVFRNDREIRVAIITECL